MIRYVDLKKKDIKYIQELTLKSWLFTYKNIYNEKNIRKTVNQYYSDKTFGNTFKNLKDKKEKFIIAKKSQKIVGYAQVRKINSDWEITRIYVDPKIIGKGIGTELIKHIEKFLKSKKVNKYIVYPHIKNKIAKKFYYKIGCHRNPKKDRNSVSPCFEKTI